MACARPGRARSAPRGRDIAPGPGVRRDRLARRDKDYADSHAFAVQATEAGFVGIRYFVRHDPSQRLYGIALFGEPGGVGAGGSTWPAPEVVAIPDELVEAARRTFGYQVLPAP